MGVAVLALWSDKRCADESWNPKEEEKTISDDLSFMVEWSLLTTADDLWSKQRYN